MTGNGLANGGGKAQPAMPAVAGLYLLFASGKRPSAAEIMQLAAERVPATVGGFAVGHRPDPGTGWLELVASGLAFELSGLHPAAAATHPQVEHRFGIEVEGRRRGDHLARAEALLLEPAHHLVGGVAMLPVVRTMLGLGLRLAELPGLVALSWGPARTLIGPGLFVRQVGSWLEGGAFPALGLTALAQREDGILTSEGLDWFIGQELQINSGKIGGPQAAARIAVRLIHALVEDGPLRVRTEIEGFDGQRLVAEPAQGGRIVRVEPIA